MLCCDHRAVRRLDRPEERVAVVRGWLLGSLDSQAWMPLVLVIPAFAACCWQVASATLIDTMLLGPMAPVNE